MSEDANYSRTVTFPNNKVIGSITITSKYVPNHGAPCKIDINPAEGLQHADRDEFWLALQKATYQLNQTPDGYKKNLNEFGDRDNIFDPLGNGGINHVLAGGETAQIDSITTENLKNVTAKFLRYIKNQDMISGDELSKAYAELDLPRATLAFVAGTERGRF